MSDRFSCSVYHDRDLSAAIDLAVLARTMAGSVKSQACGDHVRPDLIGCDRRSKNQILDSQINSGDQERMMNRMKMKNKLFLWRLVVMFRSREIPMSDEIMDKFTEEDAVFYQKHDVSYFRRKFASRRIKELLETGLLTEKQKTILYLIEIENKKLKDISRILHLSYSVVRKQYGLIGAKLKNYFTQIGLFDEDSELEKRIENRNIAS